MSGKGRNSGQYDCRIYVGSWRVDPDIDGVDTVRIEETADIFGGRTEGAGCLNLLRCSGNGHQKQGEKGGKRCRADADYIDIFTLYHLNRLPRSVLRGQWLYDVYDGSVIIVVSRHCCQSSSLSSSSLSSSSLSSSPSLSSSSSASSPSSSESPSPAASSSGTGAAAFSGS